MSKPALSGRIAGVEAPDIAHASDHQQEGRLEVVRGDSLAAGLGDGVAQPGLHHTTLGVGVGDSNNRILQ